MSDNRATAAIVRAAVAADYPALRAAAARCGPAAQAALPDADTFGARAREVPLLVAVNTAAVVGYLLASPLAYDGGAPVSLWIDAVAVDPEWRRRGLGKALCAAFAATSRDLGVRALLTSPPNDPALAALLARVGFVAHRDGVLLWRLDASEAAVSSR